MTPAKLFRALFDQSGLIMISRLAGAGIGLLTQLLMVRLVGPHELGLFYAASSLAAVLGVVAAQGYPLTAARFVGRYRNKNSEALCGIFTGQTLRESLLAATIAAIAVIVWTLTWPGLSDGARWPYVIAAWMILATTAINILTGIAGGMRLFLLCYVPEGFGRPIAFFVIVAAAGAVGFDLGAMPAMLAFAAITMALALYLGIKLARDVPHIRWRGEARKPLSWRWRREAWQLIFLAVFTNFFADVGILVVVPFLSAVDVAVFGMCLKLALLVGYFVQVGQQMVVPDMVDARHAGDFPRLQRAAWRSIVSPTALTLAAMAFVYVFGPVLLPVFGPEFGRGYSALLILLAAQLLRSLAGPSAHLLTLSGVQSVNMGLSASAIAVLFAASAALTPKFGINGAALAVLLTYAYWIGASAVALKRLREPSVDIVWLTWNSLRRA